MGNKRPLMVELISSVAVAQTAGIGASSPSTHVSAKDRKPPIALKN